MNALATPFYGHPRTSSGASACDAGEAGPDAMLASNHHEPSRLQLQRAITSPHPLRAATEADEAGAFSRRLSHQLDLPLAGGVHKRKGTQQHRRAATSKSSSDMSGDDVELSPQVDSTGKGKGVKKAHAELIKERNREAQRRCRARNKELLDGLSSRVRTLLKQVEQKDSELESLRQHNHALQMQLSSLLAGLPPAPVDVVMQPSGPSAANSPVAALPPIGQAPPVALESLAAQQQLMQLARSTMAGGPSSSGSETSYTHTLQLGSAGASLQLGSAGASLQMPLLAPAAAAAPAALSMPCKMAQQQHGQQQLVMLPAAALGQLQQGQLQLSTQLVQQLCVQQQHGQMGAAAPTAAHAPQNLQQVILLTI